MNISCRKSFFRTSCLLLCLLFMNACTSRTPAPEEPDFSDPELEALEKKAGITPVKKKQGEKKKKRQLKRVTVQQVKKKLKNKRPEKKKERKKRRWQKKKTDIKGKKLLGTQRPYVIEGQTYYPIPSAQGYEETGLASWYGDPFHGRKTANGETYDMYGGTAAHKTLPMNTMLLVKNLTNGRTATVRINDRGPFVDGRIIDLSYTTAKNLGILRNGTEKVQITALCATEEQDRNRENQEAEERDNGVPVLTAQGKKKDSEKASERKTGAICSVISPENKKQRIRQDFDKGNFYIQIGSFEKKKDARELARTFADKGRNMVIQEFAAAGTTLFRVLVFSSTSLKEAKKYNEKLRKQGYEHAFVVARDKPPKKTGKKR